MVILFRIFAGVVGAIFGAIAGFIMDLTIGDGVQFVPISKFVIPLAIGGAIGFCLGFIFYKITGKLFSFLSRFSIETST